MRQKEREDGEGEKQNYWFNPYRETASLKGTWYFIDYRSSCSKF